MSLDKGVFPSRQPLRPSPHTHCIRRDSAVVYLSSAGCTNDHRTKLAPRSRTGRASTGTRGRWGLVSNGTRERSHLQTSFPESLYL
ncbi:hypothetical protein CDEST_08053 [Colletotrichum destructivum]|uniref:Uncharacterized protein n=1 Tax=Colletotrichum destructivum TaxID=34406 RepID=A0AAX4IIE0_9PEZI|nr:hypothetical protein CDEST_08053 [Colletotrichum destructivum]